MSSDINKLTDLLLESTVRCSANHVKLRECSENNEVSSFCEALRPEQFSCRESPAWQRLKPTDFSKLVLGRRHMGQMLFGRLIVEAFPATVRIRMKAFSNVMQGPPVYYNVVTVITAVEDLKIFGKALRLEIHNVAETEDSVRAVQNAFPCGLRIFIKEPLFTMSNDGKGVLRVDNPMDIILETSKIFARAGAGNLGNAKVTSLKSESELVRYLDDLRTEANSFFRGESYYLALDRYTKSIDHILVRVPKEDRSACRTVPVVLREKLILSYSNRAEASLRLKSYEEAWKDTTAVLELDPRNIKALVRKGRAAQGLRIYQLALSIFEAALCKSRAEVPTVTAQSKEIEDHLKLTRTRLSESADGKFDLSAFYNTGIGSNLEFADFVGAVAMKADSRGVGLYATKDIEPGELLFVSNCLGVATWTLTNEEAFQNLDFVVNRTIYAKKGHDLFVEILEHVKNSTQDLAKLYSLDRITQAQAAAGTSQSSSMSIDMFRGVRTCIPNEERKLQIDVGRIRKILSTGLPFFGNIVNIPENLHGIEPDPHQEVSARNRPSIPKAVALCGLWVLLAFLRNSCSPNSWILRVGKALFVRSMRRIAAGEELTVFLLNEILHSTKVRQDLANMLSLGCDCERCILEKNLGMHTTMLAEQRKIYAKLLDSMGRQVAQIAGVGGPPPPLSSEVLSGLKDLVSQIEPIISEVSSSHGLTLKQQRWLRASFMDPYLHLAPRERDSLKKMQMYRLMLDSTVAVGDTYRSLGYVCEIQTLAKQVYANKNRQYQAVKEELTTICKNFLGEISAGTLKKLMKNKFRSIGTDSKKVRLAFPH